MHKLKTIISFFICLLVVSGSYNSIAATPIREVKKEMQEKDKEEVSPSCSSFEAVLQAPDFEFDNDFSLERTEISLAVEFTSTEVSNKLPKTSFFEKLYSSSILINAP